MRPGERLRPTGPTIGRPSAVTVARASSRIPIKRSQSSSAGIRRSGVVILRRCGPASS